VQSAQVSVRLGPVRPTRCSSMTTNENPPSASQSPRSGASRRQIATPISSAALPPSNPLRVRAAITDPTPGSARSTVGEGLSDTRSTLSSTCPWASLGSPTRRPSRRKRRLPGLRTQDSPCRLAMTWARTHLMSRCDVSNTAEDGAGQPTLVEEDTLADRATKPWARRLWVRTP
jgi:hypothetical protein